MMTTENTATSAAEAIGDDHHTAASLAAFRKAAMAAAQSKNRTPAQSEDDAALLESEFARVARTELGLEDARASQVARAFVLGLRRNYGAQRIYIPCIDKTERNRSIRAEFNGTNAAQVMRRHSISRARLYQIVKEGGGVGVACAGAGSGVSAGAGAGAKV
jgi:Mor family transcriptional regulator